MLFLSNISEYLLNGKSENKKTTTHRCKHLQPYKQTNKQTNKQKEARKKPTSKRSSENR
jgi:hypothetical protein